MRRATASDTNSLKLHTAEDGIVWYAKGEREARSSGLGLGGFLGQGLHLQLPFVRLTGCHDNAAMIVQLHVAKQAGLVTGIQLASPLTCTTARQRRSPVEVVRQLRRVALAPSQGGFHDVTAQTVVGYELIAAQATGRSLRDIVRLHPAWRAVQFASPLDEDALAELIALVRDPRWYVDVCNPDRLTKLYTFLGLDPRTQASVTVAGPRQAHTNRCAAVSRVWRRAQLVNDPRQITALPPSFEAPGMFLWRTWAKYASRDRGDRLVMADLRTSQRLVAFLRGVWLRELYRDARGVSDNLFSAIDFFRDASEAAGFEAFCGGA